jgi:serine/threonine-protein kinase
MQTVAGAIIGTPEFMSPEQAAGRSVDHRTDIYAVGVILYNATTGVLPFVGNSFGELLVKHVTLTPPAPRAIVAVPQLIPEPLDALIMQCLEKDPARRPASMDALADRLLSISKLASLPVEFFAQPPMDWSSPRRRIASVVAVATAAAIAIGAGLYAVSGTDADRPTSGTAPDAAPAAATVAVMLDSMPRGAQVYRLEDRALLGTTPLQLALPRSEQPLHVEFLLAGYRTMQRDLPLMVDGELMVRLVGLADFERDITIDPFAKQK